jgi:UDP-2,3-diacylglucosamine pyrophosphatase LpxH
MKLIIFSDTHFRKNKDFDVFFKTLLEANPDHKDMRAVLAGDIFDSPFSESGKLIPLVPYIFKHLSAYFKEVYFLMGNHEFYKHKKGSFFLDINTSIFIFKNICKYYLNIKFVTKGNFFFLPEEDYEIMGCTLWSKLTYESFKDSSSSRHVCDDYIPLNIINREETEFIRNKKSKPFFDQRDIPLKKSIVITHYPPVLECVPDDIVHKGRYGNDFDDSIFDNIDYWICGHVHESYEKNINGCKILLNPYLKNSTFRYEAYDI